MLDEHELPFLLADDENPSAIERTEQPVRELQAFPWRLTATGLSLPEDTPLPACLEMAAALDVMEGAVQWWRGDLWLFMDRPYGEFASQAAHDELKDSTGTAYSTWMHCSTVASAFQFCRRRQNLTWKHHAEVAKLDDSLADQWLDAAEQGDRNGRWSAARLRREIDRAERIGVLPWEEAELPIALPDSEECRVLVGDFRQALAFLPDSSVDAIITDPPYPEAFIPLYGDLAKLAARVLKPGGSLLAMAGQTYLPAVLAAMAEHMTYYWPLAYLTPGQAPSLWHRQVNTNWKPVFWFVKGGVYDGASVSDIVESDANDKQFHDWGQSESGMARLIERFTQPGELVVDPFLGGGTTGVAALRLNRRFIGAEVSEETASVARRRLAVVLGLEAA